jgi:hypothetical protein
MLFTLDIYPANNSIGITTTGIRAKADLMLENMLLMRIPKELPKKTRSIRAARKRKNISAVRRNPMAQKIIRVKSTGINN